MVLGITEKSEGVALGQCYARDKECSVLCATGSALGCCSCFSSSWLLKRSWCQVKEGYVNRRATGTKDHASETITVPLFAGTRVSPVANAGVSVVVVSVPSFAKC
ncbi:hypothetical protein FEM48_ZijujUnG0115000 [Ziziphus jujuba var. spinosa]|uniref:Uncharacterized protein n=1 Tax=Ziziphus jujuba var. spinosa TaxID=714518 RepID=A0A978U7Y2_ZIZJJ|nr:hypothetical protein FEM48_ZijujUnG0115000 [Ziziphus jujuba var. spinosa]